MRHYLSLALCILIFIGGVHVQTAYALQDENMPRLVYSANGDIYMAELDGGNPIQLADGSSLDPLNFDSSAQSFHSPVVASDGSVVYFQNWFDNRIRRVSLEGDNTLEVLPDVTTTAAFGITLSQDGQRLGAVASRQGRFYFQEYHLPSLSVRRETQIAFDGGCGSGPYLPDSFQFFAQTGELGNPLLLDWGAGGVGIASMGCDSRGVQLVYFDEQIADPILPLVSNARLNPTAQLIAGFNGDRLIVSDLATREIVNLQESWTGFYDQFYWISPNELVFSIAMPLVNESFALQPEDTDIADEVLYGAWQSQVPRYRVALYHWNIEEDTARLLWNSRDLRGIARYAIYENWLYFSAVDNLSNIVDALNSGSSREDIINARPTSSIYRLDLTAEDSIPERIISGGESPSITLASNP